MRVSNFHITCSQTLSNFDAMIQTFILLVKADSLVFPSYINFWFTVANCLLNAFFVIQVFLFFWLGEIKDIFQFCFIFTEGEKKER